MNGNATVGHNMSLSELLSRIRITDGRVGHVDVPDDWLQGRAIYGGLSTALCLYSALAVADELPPLRSAQVAFVAPAGPTVRLCPTILRQGRSASFVATDMQRDDGALATRASFCFATARESRLAYDDHPAPAVCAPEEAAGFFEDEVGRSRGPAFAEHFDSRLAAGALPLSGATVPELTAWIRHRDDGSVAPFVALAALADALPPAAMACFAQAAPVSSMTWQFDTLSPVPTSRDGWWLCQSRAERVAEGYAVQHMAVWNRDLVPVLVGRQTVAVFY